MNPHDAWNNAAEGWRHFVHSGADYYRLVVHGPALLRACGDVRGARCLDLGCGEGYFSRELAAAGATVTGVDVSEAQIRFALEMEAESPQGITFCVLDARDIAAHFTGGAFDLIAACMSLQDMADAEAVFDGVPAVLRPGGRMVFSVPHPANDTPFREWERDEDGSKIVLRVDRYFDTGPAVMDWSMPRLRYEWSTPFWRRTIEEWTALTARAGLLIRRIREPRPTVGEVAADPRLEDSARMPYFLVFDTILPAVVERDASGDSG